MALGFFQSLAKSPIRGAEGKVEKTLIFDIMTNVFWSRKMDDTPTEKNAYVHMCVCVCVCVCVVFVCFFDFSKTLMNQHYGESEKKLLWTQPRRRMKR